MLHGMDKEKKRQSRGCCLRSSGMSNIMFHSKCGIYATVNSYSFAFTTAFTLKKQDPNSQLNTSLYGSTKFLTVIAGLKNQYYPITL